MSSSLVEKARRLHQEERVKFLDQTGDRRRFQVQGDHDSYVVEWKDGGVVTCECPAMADYGRDMCSHVLAAVLEWTAANAGD